MATQAMITSGIVFKNGDGKQQKLVVRFTSDALGESLSISDDKSLMLLIDFDGVERFIDRVRDFSRWKESKDETDRR